MKKITHSEFVQALREHGGTAILTIVAETEPKFRKTNCPFSSIKRRVYRKMVPGASYENAVAKAGGKDFKPEPLPWGEWFVPGKVLTHNGKFYLRSKFSHDDAAPFESEFFADGERVAVEVVKDYLVSSSPSKRQLEAGVAEGEQVEIRAYTFDNIKQIAFNGEKAELVPDN